MTRGGEVVSCEAHNLETAVQFGPPQQDKNLKQPYTPLVAGSGLTKFLLEILYRAGVAQW